jgi:sugar phosphate isomerase/epimerase
MPEHHHSLAERLGTGPGGPRLEDGLAWAAEHGFLYVDFNADHGPNALSTWTAARIEAVRATCAAHDLHLGIHTLSAVNVAEFSPFVSEAVDAYLRAHIDLAARLGAEHVITHAGLHQSSELELRWQASLDRLQRAAEYAEARQVRLLLENMNKEPDDAEVHYMGHTVEELRRYFERIASPALQWGFSANHAHLLPGDFDAFLDAFGTQRIGLVLVADNRGQVEEHLLPGEGTLDFARLFGRLEGAGYRGPYMLTFGTREQKLRGREYLLAQATQPA